PAAKKFLRQIKDTFERHDYLKALYHDVLWADPRQQSPKWSEDEGIVVNRKSTPKEATIEAGGLIDGMPTGAHYKLRVYDDLVTEKSVTHELSFEVALDGLADTYDKLAEGAERRNVPQHT